MSERTGDRNTTKNAYVTKWILCGLVLLLQVDWGTSKQMSEDVPTVDVQGAEGGLARLPCDVTPAVPGDKTELVIWFLEATEKPVYTFDARNTALDGAVRWQDEHILGQRAVFQHKRPASLLIQNVREADAGVYRCRVDFKRSPTRHYRVNFTVIVPPKRIMFLDGNGENIPHYILGPYNEGSTVEITCIAVGGRPPPRVTWWQDNTLLDDRWEVLSGERVRNKLRLQRLSRRQLHATLTCQAESSPLAAPVSGSVTLDLNLRPLWVRLMGRNRPLSADTPYEFDCEAVGTRPPPVFSWWKAGVQLRNTRETTSPDGNTTTSTLTFVPTIEDSGKLLTCRANTPLIPDSTLEDSWKLDIYHVPVVSLELGGNLNASNIKEGQDVYFECNIKSNPWVYKVSWRHNGKPLYNNVTAGTILSNQSLVLQAVTRARAGLYTCVGSNQEGDGESNPVYLDVKFRPLCAAGQQHTYGVARQETARVSCEVEANPVDGLSFIWRFNSSADSADMPSAAVTAERLRSTLHYTPRSELDYGSLLCWAVNAMGRQITPCVFHVVPAGRPDTPYNCSISNQTADSLHVECSEGFDGGLPQQFVMEVYDAVSQQLAANVSSRTAVFTVSGLPPGQGLQLAVFAVNAKGRSRIVPLHAYTLQAAERRAVSAMGPGVGPLLGVIAGCAAVALLLATIVVALVVRARRRRRMRGYKAANCDAGLTDAFSTGKEAAEAAAAAGAAHAGGGGSCDSIDDKNPDVVPHNSDADVQDDDEEVDHGHQRRPSRDDTTNGPCGNVRYISRNGDELTYIELSLPKTTSSTPRPTVRFRDEVMTMEPGGGIGRIGYSSLPRRPQALTARRPSADGNTAVHHFATRPLLAAHHPTDSPGYVAGGNATRF